MSSLLRVLELLKLWEVLWTSLVPLGRTRNRLLPTWLFLFWEGSPRFPNTWMRVPFLRWIWRGTRGYLWERCRRRTWAGIWQTSRDDNEQERKFLSYSEGILFTILERMGLWTCDTFKYSHVLRSVSQMRVSSPRQRALCLCALTSEHCSMTGTVPLRLTLKPCFVTQHLHWYCGIHSAIWRMWQHDVTCMFLFQFSQHLLFREKSNLRKK